MLPGSAPASCTDSTDHHTDGTHRAGTIQGAVPRTVPRLRPCVTLSCSLCVASRWSTSRCADQPILACWVEVARRLAPAGWFRGAMRSWAWSPLASGSRPGGCVVVDNCGAGADSTPMRAAAAVAAALSMRTRTATGRTPAGHGWTSAVQRTTASVQPQQLPGWRATSCP